MSKDPIKNTKTEITLKWWRSPLQARALFALVFTIGIFLSSLGLAAAPLCSSVFSPESSESFVYFGKEIQEPIAQLLQKAEHSIDLELSLDAKSPLFPLLQKKAAQGVKIRMVLENRDFYKEPARQREWFDMLQTLKESNIEFVTSDYNDVSQYRAFPRSYLHRKLVIVDQHSFYVGSSNFSRNVGNVEVGYFGKMHDQLSLQEVFNADHTASAKSWKNVKPTTILPEAELKKVSLIGPGTENPDFQSYILKAIEKTQNRIVISAFEAGDGQILKALINKKKQNPAMRIQILLSSDPMPVRFGERKVMVEKSLNYKAQLQKAGIEVRDYTQKNSLNHSRMGIFDDTVYGSSADFTQRGFNGNVELGFALKSEEMSKSTLESFDVIWKSSQQAQEATLKERIIATFVNFYDQISILIIKSRLLLSGST